MSLHPTAPAAGDLELLDKYDVARLTGLSPKTIERCINATKSDGAVRPFPGWKLMGRKRVTTRANLAAWIDNLPDA